MSLYYSKEVWESFGDKVGWRKGGIWLSYSDLTFSKNHRGQLPALRMWWDDYYGVCNGDWMNFFESRVDL